MQPRNIWILCDLGGVLESSLVTNQVCLPFSSSVIHLNTCAWEKTSSSHPGLHKHVDMCLPLNPGKAAQSPSSPWRYFEDTQIEETYHRLNPPTPDLKKYKNKWKRKKKLSPTSLNVSVSYFQVCMTGTPFSSWMCSLLSAVWVSDTHSQGLPLVPRVCRECRILRYSLYI